MIRQEKCIVMDLDGTLCLPKTKEQTYLDLLPDESVLAKLLEYKAAGFYIILYTARNMRSYQGNLGLIMANTAKDLFTWLAKHEIPYDELHFGKPWPGKGGFYVDDMAIRPDEFKRLSYEEILKLLGSAD